MTDDPHITISDIRPLFCVKGAKKAFDAAGIDFRHFIKNGAMASELRGHGYDAIIERVVKSIHDKEQSDGR